MVEQMDWTREVGYRDPPRELTPEELQERKLARLAEDQALSQLKMIPPHIKSRPTSRAAALASMEGAPNKRTRVLTYIMLQRDRGATDEEVSLALHMPDNTTRPRRWELAKLGLILRKGTRKTLSGQEADVWVWRGFKDLNGLHHG